MYTILPAIYRPRLENVTSTSFLIDISATVLKVGHILHASKGGARQHASRRHKMSLQTAPTKRIVDSDGKQDRIA